MQRAWAAWKAHVHEGATANVFTDDLAQVVAYGLAIAALRGGADANNDRLITLDEARAALQDSNQVLAAALGPALGVPGLLTAVAAEVGAIERLVSVVDRAAIAASGDPRGEPWLWFYEDFLASYDPVARKATGVYYTPTAVVDTQVRLVDDILRRVMRKKLGFGDAKVVTLDPATGSGTYPLAVVDQAAARAVEQRGPAGAQQIARTLTDNLIAFELLPGPYAVAHLRIGQRLAELSEAFLPPGDVRVYLTDTLEDPTGPGAPVTLWGDVAVLAEEQGRARQVKTLQPVTVVIGNPPYSRGTSDNGGWVTHPRTGKPLFDDVIRPAQTAGVVFAAQASLYNDYVYFWRWALWKAFEQLPATPAVVSFITAASWLTGPAFLGLRALARRHADEIWVIDLGGDNRASEADENVFAIQTPVAIVTLFRRSMSTTADATVLYQQIRGSRSDKLEQLRQVLPPAVDPASWVGVPGTLGDPLLPRTGEATWLDLPALADLLPWQQPGCKLNRAWPIPPAPDVLVRRWQALLAQPDAATKAAAFVTNSAGRNIYTRVAGMPPVAELPRDAPHRPLVRYGYRSFDRQWTLEDARLAKTESPSLWRTRSPRQLFLTTLMTTALGPGPALTVTTAVPDLHYFKGSYGGKDVIPLYCDAAAKRANITDGLLELLADIYGVHVSAEDFVAYVYALLSHPGYQQRFATELFTPGPRVPLTACPALFAKGARVGSELLWLHTFAERYRHEAAGRGSELPVLPGLGWTAAVTDLPDSLDDVTYNHATRTLTIGAGTVSGVEPGVWSYSVSGFPVVERWIGARTRRGVGRAASRPEPLDRIRPDQWFDEWNDELLGVLRALAQTLRLHDEQALLLTQVLAGAMLTANELPQPAAHERAVPT